MRKEVAEKINDLVAKGQGLVEKAELEKRELTPDEAAELAEIRDDVKKIKAAVVVEDEMRELAPVEVKADTTPREEKEDVETREIREFARMIREGTMSQRVNNLDDGSTSGGDLIPKTIANRIIRKVYDICPILEKSTKYNVKGQLDLPFYDEGTTAITVAYASEFSDLTSAVGAFDVVTLNGFLAGALVKVGRNLINKTDFNIVDYVVDAMAYSIKRFIEGELINGTSQKVKGLGGSTIAQGVTAAATNAITADEVVELHDAIKDEFQANACWIMSPATRTALRTLTDEMGRYLLQDDISLPFGASLLGKPVFVSDNMPDMAAGKKAIYYGDLSGLATKFTEEINIQVLREVYAPQHAVGIVGWFNFDAAVYEPQKLAVLTMKAS